MQTLDQSLVKAYKDGLIDREEALRFADSANDVRLQIKMHDRGEFGTGDGLGLAFDEYDNEGRFHGR
jgi:twitching motility protein PilU